MMILRVNNDPDLENPCDTDGWRLYSFSDRHNSYKHPEKLGLAMRLGEDGKPVVRNPGLRRKLETGLAFWLSYYEHGRCLWMLYGEERPGVEFRWDGTRIAGLLVWEEPPKNLGLKTYEERASSARLFLENYTSWCNGEGVCFSLEDEAGEIIDSCCGLYSIQDVIDEVVVGLKGQRVKVQGDLAETVRLYYPVEGCEYV